MLKNHEDIEDSDYQVPTFKGLIEQYERERSQQNKTEDQLQETSSFKNIKITNYTDEASNLSKRYEINKKY